MCIQTCACVIKPMIFQALERERLYTRCRAIAQNEKNTCADSVCVCCCWWCACSRAAGIINWANRGCQKALVFCPLTCGRALSPGNRANFTHSGTSHFALVLSSPVSRGEDDSAAALPRRASIFALCKRRGEVSRNLGSGVVLVLLGFFFVLGTFGGRMLSAKVERWVWMMTVFYLLNMWWESIEKTVLYTYIRIETFKFLNHVWQGDVFDRRVRW